uniref:Uncharacterized protein n=1 Tax=Bursaphelenchus xylophilus TaxID=6326 RepID=A0A1I7RYU3_BURXY
MAVDSSASEVQRRKCISASLRTYRQQCKRVRCSECQQAVVDCLKAQAETNTWVLAPESCCNKCPAKFSTLCTIFKALWRFEELTLE